MQIPSTNELAHLLAELALPEARTSALRRVEICRRALALIGPEQASHRIELKRELGDALLLDRSASRPESLDEAVELFREILEDYPSTAPRLFRMRALESLGNALRNRLRGPRAQNVEEAIGRYREALALLHREEDPVAWALLQGSLGMAWSERILGDRVENVELAIAAYEQAMEVFTREAYPIEWAVTANNLANMYRDRLRGDRADNLERAIQIYEQALEVRRRETHEVQWAVTAHNLAIACRRRLRGNSEDNIDRAIDLALQALQVRTREAAPLRWAQTQCTLGNAWAERRRGDSAENLRRALDAYESALEVMAPASPFQGATILRNLGKIRGLLFLQHGEGDVETALAACRAALEIHQAETAPHEHREAADFLGLIFFGLPRWGEAVEAFSSALKASEFLYQAGATPESRHAELREGGDLASRAAYSLARVGRLAEAVETLERSRTRALGESLDRDEALLEQVQETDRLAFQKYREKIRALEAEARSAGSTGSRSFLEISNDLRRVRQELSGLAETIRLDVPDFLEEGLQFSGICDLATKLGRPLIQILNVAWGGLALIITPGANASQQVQAVWMHGLSYNEAQELLFAGDHPFLPEEEPDSTTIKTALKRVAPILEEHFMKPVAAALLALGFNRGILLPAGFLSLLPLPALACEVLLTSAPSARLLLTAVSRARERRNVPLSFLGVGTGAPLYPLPFAHREVEGVATTFPPDHRRLLLGREAHRAAIFSGMAGASHLHFACHGCFDPAAPLASALHLTGGERLTVRDLLDGNLDLSAARLAVLSACRSGLVEYRDTPDETLGFPAVLLKAGIPAVIGTLWPVEDLSSALLMERFYEIHIKERQPAGEALRSAQNWLRQATAVELGLADRAEEFFRQARTPEERATAYLLRRRSHSRPDVRPYADLYYWAGYFLTGDPDVEQSP